ncbi:hypothetical protein K488DRAFT_85171 [Vararia minispora EC-137]|uniref:Uncharacterized protein n=1 Tax=Vararia minispora EC-137 TaxID=1314806 RepID=A0ACB8QNF5_9AGAM|nr:hypothetical protein K488DRAFT_85171 [Vararia minispora EC-137]
MAASYTSFAPYAPPPDEQLNASDQSSSSRFNRPWFPSQPSLSYSQSQSYQSGGVPTLETATATGFGSDDVVAAAVEDGPSSLWETRFGYRVDVLAAFAYVLGPISAFLLLALETHNDYARFHAYQSALLSTPLLLLRIIASIFALAGFFKLLFSLLLVGPCLFMAYRAFIDASRNGLARYHLPFVGDLADQWLHDE